MTVFRRVMLRDENSLAQYAAKVNGCESFTFTNIYAILI